MLVVAFDDIVKFGSDCSHVTPKWVKIFSNSLTSKAKVSTTDMFSNTFENILNYYELQASKIKKLNVLIAR